MAWLTGWDYRREVTITNNVASDLTDHQVAIDLDLVSAVAASKANSDLSDLRVTSSDGETLLDFFREYTGGVLSDENNWWHWEENPVLKGTSSTWDANWNHPYSILDINGTLYLYYGGSASGGINGPPTQTGLATSSDGITWTKHASNPIFSPGTSGQWDDNKIDHFCVLKEDDNWYAWYGGESGSTDWQVGYATSSDGISWTRYGSNPVLSGDSGQWDSVFVVPSKVWKEGSTYYMVYWGGNNAADHSSWKIGLATSTDRVTWTKEATNPIFEGDTGEWDDGVLDLDIVKLGSTYYMFYQGNTADQNNSAIGIATSTDLTTWTRDADNPIAREGYWDGTWNEGPVLIQVDDTWHMYYMGYGGGANGNLNIGLMKFKPTRLWVKVPSITAISTATVYVYYGNSEASDVSSGGDTFPTLFEDFDGGPPWTGWTNAGSFTGGTDRGSATAEKTAATGNYYLYTTSTFAPPLIVEARARVGNDWGDENSWHWRLDLSDTGGALNNSILCGHFKDNTPNDFYLVRYVGGVATHTQTETRGINANWTKLGLHVAASGSIVFKYNDGRSLSIAQNPPAANFAVQLNTARTASYTTSFDKVWIRAYAATEPTASVAAEATEPVVSSSSTQGILNHPAFFGGLAMI